MEDRSPSGIQGRFRDRAATGGTSLTVDVPQEFLVEAYRRMTRIRQFEEATKELAVRGELYGSFHTSTGQEATIVGACMALRADDYMVGNHRSHGHPIGKGAKLDRLLAELMGKETGVNQGKGGSMHLSDFSVGSLGESSIVGSGLPVATGAALGAKLQDSGRVALCFFGDGASNQGTFHESLNLAALWQLPAVYVCENNGYGEFTPVAESMVIEKISVRADGYGMPGLTVDGQDFGAVYHAVSDAVDRARSGGGPSLIECITYRFDNHSIEVPVETPRPEGELDYWMTNRDPLLLFKSVLRDAGVDLGTLARVDRSVAEELEAAVQFARSSPVPPVEAAFTHVFSNPLQAPGRLR